MHLYTLNEPPCNSGLNKVLTLPGGVPMDTTETAKNARNEIAGICCGVLFVSSLDDLVEGRNKRFLPAHYQPLSAVSQEQVFHGATTVYD